MKKNCSGMKNNRDTMTVKNTYRMNRYEYQNITYQQASAILSNV